VKTARGLQFPQPVGMSDGVTLDGKGLDGLLDCLGVQADGSKGSV